MFSLKGDIRQSCSRTLLVHSTTSYALCSLYASQPGFLGHTIGYHVDVSIKGADKY